MLHWRKNSKITSWIEYIVEFHIILLCIITSQLCTEVDIILDCTDSAYAYQNILQIPSALNMNAEDMIYMKSYR